MDRVADLEPTMARLADLKDPMLQVASLGPTMEKVAGLKTSMDRVADLESSLQAVADLNSRMDELATAFEEGEIDVDLTPLLWPFLGLVVLFTLATYTAIRLALIGKTVSR